MTTTNKCENGCNTDNLKCEYIHQYYKCSCYCCYRTTLELNHCIACGNNERNDFKPTLPPKCETCHGYLPDKIIKMCMYCEDNTMYDEDKYGYIEDDDKIMNWRNRNNYSYNQIKK